MSPFMVLAGQIGEIAGVVRQLTTADYVAPGPAGASGSVGAHVRHCLDHVEALERGMRHHLLDYDTRRRGTDIEYDREAALRQLDAARLRLSAVSDECLAQRVSLQSQIHADGTSVTAASTIGRELLFVISHTIHHAALIHVLIASAGRKVPRRFGLAPSTPAAGEDHACARSA